MKKKPIRIGIDTFEGERTQYGEKAIINVTYSYKNLARNYPEGWDGWVLAEDAVPFPYDLVSMDVTCKIINGWWTGSAWEALRMKPRDEVKAWQYRGKSHGK